ncbi:hypothetical protein OEZ86_002519 [Tetradesmus obliquus]|nr:hypothetical protein OEZ86_002519 [Tetradesmus obliquus]
MPPLIHLRASAIRRLAVLSPSCLAGSTVRGPPRSVCRTFLSGCLLVCRCAFIRRLLAAGFQGVYSRPMLANS